MVKKKQENGYDWRPRIQKKDAGSIRRKFKAACALAGMDMKDGMRIAIEDFIKKYERGLKNE